MSIAETAMKRWYHAVTTPPAANEDVLVCYYPTAAGLPRRAIGRLGANGEWRLAHETRRHGRRAIVAWAPLPAIPDALRAIP